MTERSVFWANHLMEIDAEGIFARAYAAREGLATQSLYQWRQKIDSGYKIPLRLNPISST